MKVRIHVEDSIQQKDYHPNERQQDEDEEEEQQHNDNMETVPLTPRDVNSLDNTTTLSSSSSSSSSLSVNYMRTTGYLSFFRSPEKVEQQRQQLHLRSTRKQQQNRPPPLPPRGTCRPSTMTMPSSFQDQQQKRPDAPSAVFSSVFEDVSQGDTVENLQQQLPPEASSTVFSSVFEDVYERSMGSAERISQSHRTTASTPLYPFPRAPVSTSSSVKSSSDSKEEMSSVFGSLTSTGKSRTATNVAMMTPLYSQSSSGERRCLTYPVPHLQKAGTSTPHSASSRASSSESSVFSRISGVSSYSSSSATSSSSVEGLSILSSSSHLQGETLVSLPSNEWDSADLEQGRRQRLPSVDTSRSTSIWWQPVISIPRLLVNTVQDLGMIRARLRPSIHAPRSASDNNNSHDLETLIDQHQNKMDMLHYPESEHYDFCLILQPQEVYAYWANLLDFRPEVLGYDVVEAMEEEWNAMAGCDKAGTDHTATNSSSGGSDERSSSQDGEQNDDDNDEKSVFHLTETPSTGIKRRRGHGTTPSESRSTTRHGHSISTPVPPFASIKSSRSAQRSMLAGCSSPGIYSVMSRRSMLSSTTMRKSLFERAIGSPEAQKDRSNDASPKESASTPATMSASASLVRRGWGNQAPGAATSTPSLTSPPIRSLTRGSSMTLRKPHVPLPNRGDADEDDEDEKSDQSSTEERHNPNVLRMQDIPPQRFARGIAARTNGMLPFLGALKRGIVLRKHRPGKEADFCRLSSTDGGDTIRYEIITENEEAMLAFDEQRVRYNKARYQGEECDIVAQPWSLTTEDDLEEGNKFSSVPDYVAAKQYREKRSRERGFPNRIHAFAAKVSQSGTIKASDIAVVHPAVFNDPRSDNGEQATVTFRKSKSEYSLKFSFSLIMRTDQLLGRSSQVSIDEYENRWLTGEGNETQFKYHDFEAATLGEYWLIFRGFLLLHRDAAVGRFSEQRAAGIGSHYSRLELELREQADLESDHNRLHQDEFHEPVTVGCLEKMIVKMRDLDTTYMEGYALPGAVPPPSDYFLGFRSPGTSIWSRLRQAGLQTCRAYSLDPKRVMIKIRCPPERLMDVAEVLRLKIITHDGTFAPFREDMMDIFQSLDDPLESPPDLDASNSFPFRSSVRQSIIDFIIGSRIRDSGAELSQATGLGKMIQARVPLHMCGKLNAIFDSWFYFWRRENWNGRDGRSMAHAIPRDADEKGSDTQTLQSSSTDSSSVDSKEKEIPHRLKRFFVGCFYQPLDSIEQYFGEKVTFYFAWLQHTAVHLIFLSVAGLIVFFCQLGSGNWDHPLRPFFSVVVMLWTFLVLINWKKRANSLAYRWGTMNYKEQETTRPQFHGDYVQDDITGEWIVKYPKWKRWLKYTISFPLTLLFTAGTLILILLVHANRDLQLSNYLEQKSNPTTKSDAFQFDFSVTAIGEKAPVTDVQLTSDNFRDPSFWFIIIGMPSILGLFLPLLNLILMKISVLLNDFENYRTESEYRTHLIIKVFSFRFVCYFGTLYYYAFVAIGSDQAIENGILRVSTGVLVYTTVAQWWQIFLHVCFPMGICKIRMRHRRRRLCQELRDIEMEEEEIIRLIETNEVDANVKKRQIQLVNKRLLLEQAQDGTWLEVMLPQHDSFPEYIGAVVQFTYVACFSVVLPITPLICLFNYLLCMRLDAYKLCKGRRRPLAEKTGGIGIWEHLLQVVSVISILTNCWLVGFTTSLFAKIGEIVGEVGLFAIVVAWEHVMLLIKYIMQTSISVVPKSVRDTMKREQYELDEQRNSLMRARRLQHQREEDFIIVPEPVSSASGAEVRAWRRSESTLNREMALQTIPSGECASPGVVSTEAETDAVALNSVAGDADAVDMMEPSHINNSDQT